MNFANELRIGNYVLVDDNHVPAYYQKVKAQDIVGIENGTLFKKAIYVNPIQLSSDILIKAALSHEFFHDGVVIYKFGKFNVYHQGSNIWVAEGLNHGKDYKHIKYLHQIQNLFHINEGTELNITL